MLSLIRLGDIVVASDKKGQPVTSDDLVRNLQNLHSKETSTRFLKLMILILFYPGFFGTAEPGGSHCNLLIIDPKLRKLGTITDCDKLYNGFFIGYDVMVTFVCFFYRSFSFLK